MSKHANVLLTHTAINAGSPVRVLSDAVTVSGKRNLNREPNANIFAPVEVQTQSYENFKYVVNGIRFTEETGTLTWEHVVSLYKDAYNGNNPIILNVTYGFDKTLSGLSNSTDINVVLETPTLPINVKITKDGYIPVGSLTFVETI